MSVKKRKSSPYYYYRFWYKGREFRASTGTTKREEAEQVEARIKRKLWEKDQLGEKGKHPWYKALEKFLLAKKHLASIDNYIFTFEVLTAGFDKINPDINLEDITREMVETILDEYQDERECSNARINRMSSMLRSLLNLACKEWGWIDYTPNLRFYTEEEAEPRWINVDEAKRLIHHAPPHLKDPIRFSLLTGVRQANCFGLKWEWISMDKKHIVIPRKSVKTKRVISIPVTDELQTLLIRNLGKDNKFVFTHRRRGTKLDRPFSSIDHKDTWKPLLERAGIDNFRWHDLRHTWASWHIMNGTTLSELMDLAGWSSYSMVKRYAHLSSEHLRKAAGNISIKESFGEVLELKG